MPDERKVPALGEGQAHGNLTSASENISSNSLGAKVNLVHAARFLGLLAPGGQFTFQTLDDSEARRPELIGVYHGTLDDHAAHLVELNQRGAGVYVTVNVTDGEGRRAKNVTAVRGVFADFDDPDPTRPCHWEPLPEHFRPTIIAESSPGKHHAYWLIEAQGELALEEFTPLQKALAGWLGGDPKVCDLPRVMRLPGFFHNKAEPFRTRIIHEGEPLSREALRTTLAPHMEVAEAQKPAGGGPSHSVAGDISHYARAALASATGAVFLAPEGVRNDTLNREAHGLFSLVKCGYLDGQEVRLALADAADRAGLSDEEVAATLRSAWRAAEPRHPPGHDPLADFGDAGVMLKPRPLPNSLPPVEAFDPKMLPDELRSYVMDVAKRQQSAPEFCAVVALVGLAGVVGDKVRIRPKQHDDWQVTPNLWGAMIGGPSSMKSPVLKALRFPLDAIEADMRHEHAKLVAEGGVDAKLAKMAEKEAEKTAGNLIKKGEHDKAREVLEGLASVEDPPENPRRLIINDATVEALGERLNENPNGLMLVRDELSGWLAKIQSEEHASDRAFYLECFNGGDRYTSDRIGRGIIAVENCTLSILGGIQPSKIAPVVRGAASGAEDDGLIQRFQLAVWPDPVRDWQWTDRAPDEQAKERYRLAFYRLHWLDLGADENGTPPAWSFTPEAQELFIQWATEINLEARSGDLLPIMESHLLKMPKTVCALALLFALVDGEDGEVGKVATARALAWANFLRTQAERLYSAASSAAVDGAKLILKRRGKLPHPFKAKQVQQRGWVGLGTTEAAQASLDLLEEYGYLIPIETRTGGRPRFDYYWHPSLGSDDEHIVEAAGDIPRKPPKRALRVLRGSSISAFADDTPTPPHSEGPPDNDWLH